MYSLTTLTLFPCKSVRYLFVAVSYCACVTSRHVNNNHGVKLGTHCTGRLWNTLPIPLYGSVTVSDSLNGC